MIEALISGGIAISFFIAYIANGIPISIIEIKKRITPLKNKNEKPFMQTNTKVTMNNITPAKTIKLCTSDNVSKGSFVFCSIIKIMIYKTIFVKNKFKA